jgi:hypothetical protein
MSIKTKIIYNDESQKAIIEQRIKDIRDNFKNDKEPLNNLNKLLPEFINSIELLNINGIDYSKSKLSTDFFNTFKSSILEKRNEEYIKNLKINRDIILFGIHYDEGNPLTDVNYYLGFDNCLIIYNENFNQYDDKTNCESKTDEGNGFLRKYRSDSKDKCSDTTAENRKRDGVKAFVYGIPTGIFDNKEDTIKHQDSMNDSISQIIKCINDNSRIKNVIWCVQKIKDSDFKTYNMTKPEINYELDDLDTKIITLELGIFDKCNKSVKAVKYISDILFKIFKDRKYIFSDRDTTDNEHRFFNEYFINKFVKTT